MSRADIASPDFTSEAPIDGGTVDFDAVTGAPLQFRSVNNPKRQYLLDSRQSWHAMDHQWGSGFVITSDGAFRWLSPERMSRTGKRWETVHSLHSGLELLISRSVDGCLHERYSWRNVSQQSISIQGIGIQTPFADVYPSAHESLTQAVHAHLFTGGSWAWALAEPMDGAGDLLGLTLREGLISGYSIESRNQWTHSNARGHIVLHPTDAARNRDAFAGQPVISLAPGEEFSIAWDIGFYPDRQSFLENVRAPLEFDRLRAPIGVAIEVTGSVEQLNVTGGATVRIEGERALISADRPGPVTVRYGDASSEVLFYRSLAETVRSRCDWILEHQVGHQRPGLLSYSLLPTDTRTGLQQTRNGWDDWSDGSERIGMAVLLQQAIAHDWIREDGASVVDGWARFASSLLLDPDGTPHRDSQDPGARPRLYDSPWLAQFFVDRFRLTDDPRHLDLAARIVERAFELGAEKFLAIGFSETTRDVIETLRAFGQRSRADALSVRLVASARSFVHAGTHLPEHEVNYEQSIVAPLISLFSDAHALTDDDFFLRAVEDRLPWLLAFGGPQPHHRLENVSIRHWDGYWFGTERLWGDTFPHYWSALTAVTLARLPHVLRSESTVRIARDILEANMSNYFDDGSATCAFVMPTTVDGRAAHRPDPLANDQDWHLSLWIRLIDEGVLGG